MRTITGLAAGLLLVSACSPKSSEQETNNTPLRVTCSLQGTWSRCDKYDQSSTLVQIIATDSQISETISNYNSSDACQGTPDSSFAFSADYNLGRQGMSNSIPGGTDADLSNLSGDLFGCGSQPAHTVLQFNEDCTKFHPATTAPSCDQNNRGTSFDTNPFVKQ